MTVIHGSTGSGKTTQVPQYILDYSASRKEYCSIIVTQPRRIAAMSVARRVCEERGCQLGTICGYQVTDNITCKSLTLRKYIATEVLNLKSASCSRDLCRVLLLHTHSCGFLQTLLLPKSRVNSVRIKSLFIKCSGWP